MAEQRSSAPRRHTPDKGYGPDMSRLIDEGLKHTGLDQDSRNGWSSMEAALQLGSTADLHPLLSYRDYLERAHQGEAAEWVGYILQYSDPAKVVRYDQLVQEYNACLPELKAQNDLQALKKFSARIAELFGTVNV